MAYFIARRDRFPNHLNPTGWKVARNIRYSTKAAAHAAIVADYGIWRLIDGYYRVADCDHDPDRWIWRNIICN